MHARPGRERILRCRERRSRIDRRQVCEGVQAAQDVHHPRRARIHRPDAGRRREVDGEVAYRIG